MNQIIQAIIYYRQAIILGAQQFDIHCGFQGTIPFCLKKHRNRYVDPRHLCSDSGKRYDQSSDTTTKIQYLPGINILIDMSSERGHYLLNVILPRSKEY